MEWNWLRAPAAWRAAGYRLDQQAAIFKNDCAVVFRGESKIQLAGRVLNAVGAAAAAFPGAEAGPEPGETLPSGDRQPVHSVGGHLRLRRDDAQIFRLSAEKAELAGDAGGRGAAGRTSPAVRNRASISWMFFLRVSSESWGGFTVRL